MCFSSTSESKSEPPDYVKDRMPGFLDDAQSLMSTPAAMYGGMQVAPMNALQETGLNLMTDQALYSDPQTLAARGFLTQLGGGGMANPFGGTTNPAFEQMVSNTRQGMTDSFNRGTRATTDALAARAGGYGGSSHLQAGAVNAGEFAKALGNVEAGLRSDQYNRAANIYNQDIGNQLNAAQMAPGFANLDTQAFQNLIGGGNLVQDNLQRNIDADMAQYMREYNHPFNLTDWYGGLLSQASGGYGERWGESSPSLFSSLFG